MRKNFLMLITLIAALQLAGMVLADGLSTTVSELAPNLSGTETRLLPANYDIWSCDWSPDGKALVFAGKMQGEDAVKMRIWHWSLDPMTEPVPWTNTEQLIDFSPQWSPDGTKVVMTRRNTSKSVNNNLISAIWVKEQGSGTGKQLTNGPEDRDPFWSPDGSLVVFSRAQGPYRAQLATVNPDNGSVKILQGDANELLNSPNWGVDGKIYYTRMTPMAKNVSISGQNYQVMDFGKGSIWAYNSQESKSEPEPVVVDEHDNRLPALSPDGTKLAFISSRLQTKDGNGKYDRGSLYIKNMRTGEICFVTNKVGLNGGSLNWSPDGKKLAFFTFRSIRPAVWIIQIP